MPVSGQPLQLGPWHRGVRYDLPVEEVGAQELFDMQNCRITAAGAVEMRPGTASYAGAAALGSTPTLTLAAEFKPDTSNTHVLIAAGTALYRYNSGWSAITGSTTITAADDNTFEWVNANGTFVMTNGVDTDAIKWTGSGNAAALDDDSRFSKGAHIAFFDNRLWIGNVNGATNQLWYSNTGDIETWGATSFYNFDGRILGLVPTQNALTVHTTVGIFTLIATGNASAPYSRQFRAAQAGTDGRAIVALPGGVQHFVRNDGIYAWEGGAEVRKVSYALDDRYWSTLNTARLHRAMGLYFPRNNEVWWVLPAGGSQTNMNSIAVYNTQYDRWHGPYNGWERNCIALIDDTPHLGDFDGILWDHDSSTYADGGSAIESYFETGAPAPYGGDVRVKWLSARHYYEGQNGYSMTVTQRGTGLTGENHSLDLTGGGLLLGTDSIPKEMTSADVLFQDLPLLGHTPQSSIRASIGGTNRFFSHRRIYLRHRGLGPMRQHANTPSE